MNPRWPFEDRRLLEARVGNAEVMSVRSSPTDHEPTPRTGSPLPIWIVLIPVIAIGADHWFDGLIVIMASATITGVVISIRLGRLSARLRAHDARR